jgi:hypothetical protein
LTRNTRRHVSRLVSSIEPTGQIAVVDEYVEAAEALERRRDRVPPAVLVGDVLAHEQRGIADFARERLAGILVDVGEHDARALGGQQQRIGAADATCRAGDQRDLVCDSIHVRFDFLRRWKKAGAHAAPGTWPVLTASSAAAP